MSREAPNLFFTVNWFSPSVSVETFAWGWSCHGPPQLSPWKGRARILKKSKFLSHMSLKKSQFSSHMSQTCSDLHANLYRCPTNPTLYYSKNLTITAIFGTIGLSVIPKYPPNITVLGEILSQRGSAEGHNLEATLRVAEELGAGKSFMWKADMTMTWTGYLTMTTLSYNYIVYIVYSYVYIGILQKYTRGTNKSHMGGS